MRAVILTVAYAVIMLVALVGNSLLIYFVWKKPETRTLTSFMFVNMAVADLLVALVVMPISIAHLHTDGAWISGTAGEVTCRCFYYCVFVSLTASILCLVFMAFDRFFAVMYPFRRLIWFRKPKVLSPVVWISSLVSMSFTPVMVDLNDQTSFCEFNFEKFGEEDKAIQGVFIYFFVIQYLLPLTVISILYAIVAHRLWINKVPCDVTSHIQKEREATKKRVLRMLIIIVAAFALCWLPAQVYQLIRAITKWKFELPPIVMNIGYWFAHANSAINPWLYIGLNQKFRTAFTSMTSRRSRDALTGKEVKTHPARNEDMANMQKEKKGKRKPTMPTTHATAC